MGENLIFVYVPFPQNTDMDKAKEKMLRKLETFTDKNIEDFEEVSLEYPWEDIDFDDPKQADIANLKKMAKAIIEAFFNTLDDTDVSFMRHKKDDLWFTAEMSWGDSSETYDVFRNFISLPEVLLREAGVTWYYPRIIEVVKLFVHRLQKRWKSAIPTS